MRKTGWHPPSQPIVETKTRVSSNMMHQSPTLSVHRQVYLSTSFSNRRARNLCLEPSTSQTRNVLLSTSSRAGHYSICTCSKSETISSQVGEDADSADLFPSRPRYRRVMLKVSGEALQGGFVSGIDPKVLQSVAREVAAASKQGVQVAIVVGGGNYFRGASAWSSWGLERATADYVGMLATCMNSIMLQSAIERLGIDVRVQTAIEMREIAEPYIRRRAIRHLERGRVVIFGAGTGNPFMTTDTAAALRAAEIDAEALLKATKVDGIFDCDPAKNSSAKLHRWLSFRQVMLKDLKVMDETAITLCKENDIEVVVFNLTTSGNIVRALMGDSSIGTTVSGCEPSVSEEEDWDAAWQANRPGLDSREPLAR